ncbi:MAG: VIT domain-containing protein [Dokdonella sp.]
MKASIASRLLLIPLLLLFAFAHAQKQTIAIDPRPLPAPIRMDIGKTGQPIQLQSVEMRAEIVGGVARTRVEMLFANPNDRVLEGELQFPLLAGQEVDGFALDINGELRDAVPIEKAKGKEVFEEVIRRRVDPALLETTSGENFRLRVYPMPAHGTRRVVLHYSERLDVSKGNYRYRLALANAQPLPKFSLDVRVSSPSGAPSAAWPGESALTLSPSGTWYRGEIHHDDFKARGWIEITIPGGDAKSATFEASVQPWQGENYLQVDAPIVAQHSARRIPSQVAIVWDSSMSGRLRDHAAEFSLLDAYFHAMGNGKVSLIRIRDVADVAQVFSITDGDWSSLKRALQETVYDGASDLAAWKVDAGIKEVLLFSDGLSNYGASLSAASAPRLDLRIYPVVAAAAANRGLMRQFARDGSGLGAGSLIDLAGDRAQAIDALLQAGTTVMSTGATGDGDLIVDEQALAKGRLRIAGKFRGELPERIDVRLLEPNGSQHTVAVLVGKGVDADDSSREIPLAARQWARAKIDRLSGESSRNRAEVRRLGLTFSLLTAETSLIVLDDVADYVKYDIVPPSSLRPRFDALKAATLGTERSQLNAHIDQIAAEYRDKVEWWKRDFPKTSEVHVLAKKDRPVEAQRQAMEEARPAPMTAMAPPSPPADISPREMAAGGAENASSTARRAESDKSSDDRSTESEPVMRIGLKKWTPDAPYLARLSEASDADLYAIYIDQRTDWINSSAYYLDAADVLIERKQTALGLRVLSNLAEMDLENRAILRILGYRLLQAGKPSLAVPLFEQVRDLAPFEPQSFRDLGLAYADIGEYQKAADALYEVAKREWDGRFAEIGLIALTEMNALIAAHPGTIDTSRYDERLLRNLPVDLRVVLNWDADNSDMDLWVTDPNGERAYYGNRLTRQGGRMSADLTSGYGPEEFMLKQAIPGKYKVEANYYGNRQQLVSGSVTLRLALITSFGKSNASEQSVILRLKDRQETVLVGEFEVGL